MGTQLKTYASFIKFEHTIFSLPLIFAGALLHRHEWPSVSVTWLILVAAAGARVMAMGLNRLIDAELDARNPRTQGRELPRGTIQRREAWLIVGVAGLVYLVSAAAIAPICLQLSLIPVALFVIYPYLKRFTSMAHLGLGIAWSTAPLAGWLAVSKSPTHFGEIGWLWLFSVLWVTGFDIIYATMDEVFDRGAGLHSLPAQVGSKHALRIAALLHGVACLALVALWNSQLRTPFALAWLVGIGVLLVWQHAIAARNPAVAFFQLNGLLGFLVLGFVATGV